MTTERILTFNTALREDLARLGINDRVLAQRLGLSQQAISKWRTRGFPPIARWKDLIDILGENGALATLGIAELFDGAATRMKERRLTGELAPRPEPTYVHRPMRQPAPQPSHWGEGLAFGYVTAAPPPAAAVPPPMFVGDGPALEQLLPQRLRSNVQFDLRNRASGYESPRITAHIKYQDVTSGGPSPGTANSILDLATLRIETRADKHYVVAVVSPMPMPKVTQKRQEQGQNFGVSVWWCATTSDLARRIEEVEIKSQEEETDSDD